MPFSICRSPLSVKDYRGREESIVCVHISGRTAQDQENSRWHHKVPSSNPSSIPTSCASLDQPLSLWVSWFLQLYTGNEKSFS